jgi:hypothetical protein
MTKHLKRRTRALQALVTAVAMIAVCAFAAAPRASAAVDSRGLACNYDGVTFNACFSLQYVGYFWWTAHVGLDVRLPEQYAREVLDCAPNFKASLWGDDGGGSSDDFLRNLVVDTSWPPTADASGIGARFVGLSVNNTQLDEDDGADELYARVSFFDCHTGLTRNFRTGIMQDNF